VAILNQNASFACGFLKSVACPGKAVGAAVAVQAGAPRFSVFSAGSPRPIVEEKVSRTPHTPYRTRTLRADQAHHNWRGKPHVVHASPYFSAAATRRRDIQYKAGLLERLTSTIGLRSSLLRVITPRGALPQDIILISADHILYGSKQLSFLSVSCPSRKQYSQKSFNQVDHQIASLESP
jgi:hypothetical protein